MKYSRILLLAAVILSAALHISAKPLAPDLALERALAAGSPRTGAHRSPALRSAYRLAYTAPSGSYHVFDRDGGGYIVVAGDDGACPLLAEVTSGAFAVDAVAPAAGWMLGEYDSQIRSLSAAGDDSSDSGLMDYYGTWDEISPLMTTRWNQDYPYNIYCPAVSGRSCMTGCVATAMAQVVRCIGHYDGRGSRYYDSVDASGNQVAFDYAASDFDFGIMFDSLESAPSQESVDQVARLMLACGLSVGMDYGPAESGAYSKNVVTALVGHFGYDSEYTRIYSRDDYSQAQWENMLYTQLRLGRPAYYCGAGQSGGHAFVIDGYSPAGLFHVNWGWGGMSDGYFRLSALNPAQSGIGGYGGGYSTGQNMICAVPPGADPGVVCNQMSGYIRLVGDGVFAVYYKSNGRNMMNVSVGAVIVDSSGSRVAEATFWSGQNITASGALRHDSFRYDFTRHELAPGDYRIYPAFCPDGGEYIMADMLYGQPFYLCLTVTADGEYVMADSPLVLAQADLHVAGIAPGYDIRTGFSGSFGAYLVNDGNVDYSGTIGVTIMDGSGADIGSVAVSDVMVPAGANAVVGCRFPVFEHSGLRIPAGVYALRFADGEGRVLSDGEFTLEVRAGTPFLQWTPDDNIAVTNCASVPATFISGDLWPHTPVVRTGDYHRSASLMLAFYRPDGTSALHTVSCYQGAIEPMDATLPMEAPVVEVPFGTYEVCYRKGYSQISPRCPLRVGVAADGLGYLPAAGDGVSVTLLRNVTDGGDGDVLVIPSRALVDGSMRSVTAIEPEAFKAGRSLGVVDLPPGIETVGANAFTGCRSLRQIIFRSVAPPFSFRNHIAPGLPSSAEFYVPAQAYDDYRPLLEPYNPVYAIVESIESKETVMTAPDATVSLSFHPAHPAVNPMFEIIPVDDASASVAEVSVDSVGAGSLLLAIKALRKGSASFYIRPAHRSDDYAVLTVSVPETTAICALDADEAAPAAVYDLLGRPVGADAAESTPRRLRIVVGPDGIARKILR